MLQKFRLTVERCLILDCQLTRSDGEPGEHDDDGDEVDVDACLALGGARAALPCLMEDVTSEYGGFSCFADSTPAPDTHLTLKSQVHKSDD